MKARYQAEEKTVSLLALLVSLAAFSHYWHVSELLLYGDAVAHINIARRVIDSLTPGPLQLGTVWLPLPHLLMLPLIGWDQAWQTGFAGSIPSMLAYGIATLGVLRLVSIFASRPAAIISAAAFALNPNLLYLQSTAMTESIYLAAMVWSCTYFVDFWVAVRHQEWDVASSVLPRTGVALLLACLTRYDGWFLAAIIGSCVAIRWVHLEKTRRAALQRPLRNFLVLTAIAPVTWLVYNYAVYGNALEFATGAYSARAIAERTTQAGSPPYPGQHHLVTASTYFLKAVKLNIGVGPWEKVLFFWCLVAAVIAIVDRRFRPALILWTPWLFYSWSIAYGGVPIFVPDWWPFSFYNVRYGIQLLPAFAVFTGVMFEILRRINLNRVYTAILLLGTLILLTASYHSVWRNVPITLQEARANAKSRLAFEQSLAMALRNLPNDSTLLMFTGSNSGAIQMSGIHFRRVINEGNWRIWQRALDAPAASAGYVVASDGDPVHGAVERNPSGLQTLLVLQSSGRPRTVIYKGIGSAGK